MKVRELIEILQGFDPETPVGICRDEEWFEFVNDVSSDNYFSHPLVATHTEYTMVDYMTLEGIIDEEFSTEEEREKAFSEAVRSKVVILS